MKKVPSPAEPDVMTPQAKSLARVYAEALADSLGSLHDPDALAEELAEVAEAVTQVEGSGELLADASMSRQQRVELVERVFTPRVSKPIASTLGVLATNNRLGLIATIAGEFQDILEERSGNIDVFVQVAVEPGEAQLAELKETLAKALGMKPNIITEMNPDVIGGMIIRVGDTIYDASLAGRLQRMAASMGKGKRNNTYEG